MENPNYISQEEFERIERFLVGEMPEDERHSFEKEISENEALRQYVAEISIILQEVATNKLRDAMNDFHEELVDSNTVESLPQSLKRTVWWPWAVAASIALALCLWVFIGNQNANERLFTAYFTPDPGLVTAMGVSDQYEFDRGMVDYKMGQYQSAIDRWEKLLQQKPENDTLNYFLGSSYLAARQGEKAIAHFQTTLNAENSLFAEDAWWYLGLTWLRQGDIEKAKEALLRSSKPEAKMLLEELGNRPQ